jgi:hypothetical protein
MPGYNSQRRGMARTSQIFCFDCYLCSILCILCIVCAYMCTVLLPPGVNPTAVKKSIFPSPTTLHVMFNLIMRAEHFPNSWSEKKIGGCFTIMHKVKLLLQRYFSENFILWRGIVLHWGLSYIQINIMNSRFYNVINQSLNPYT